MRFSQKNVIFSVILTVLISLNGFAQEITVLDLERSVDLALKNNPNIRTPITPIEMENISAYTELI